jgi:hypothetical protein
MADDSKAFDHCVNRFSKLRTKRNPRWSDATHGIGPIERELWPAVEAIQWHRGNVFQNETVHLDP